MPKGVPAAPSGWKRTLLRKNCSNAFVLSPITITLHGLGAASLSSNEVAAREYRLPQGPLRRLQFLRACN